MSSNVPPRKRPGAPETKPPPDDFDEAPTSVAPSKVRPAMPREFDPGGALDEDEPVTSVKHEPKTPPAIRPEDDDDTAPTKDT
jgi:hypothetical protein